MTGPQHYQKAEALLRRAEGEELEWAAHTVAQAHAHFAAATAAATALQAALSLIGDDQQVTEWCRAIGATVDTNQGARITSSLFQIDELDRLGLIAPGSARKLREALGRTGGA